MFVFAFLVWKKLFETNIQFNDVDETINDLIEMLLQNILDIYYLEIPRMLSFLVLYRRKCHPVIMGGHHVVMYPFSISYTIYIKKNLTRYAKYGMIFFVFCKKLKSSLNKSLY